MPDFSLMFEKLDTQIFKALGDVITVTPKGGESVTINAPFYLVHDDEELIDRVDGDYPHLKDVKAVDLHLFKLGTIVEYNGNRYSYQTKNPNGANTWEIELREEIKTW